MCAIIDANVAHELVRPNRPEAGARFLDYVEAGKLKVVVGGRLRQELERTRMRVWIQQALLAEKVRSVNDSQVDRYTEDLEQSGECISDDPHIIALAQISGARLLYSNDINLQKDFKNYRLVSGPRGRVYTTLRYRTFHESHRGLLERRDLCGS